MPRSADRALLLRSRLVVPVARPVVEDGAVLLAGNRIAAVGAWKELSRQHSGEVVDLGGRILLPGLINAHCHLDYTGMAGQLRPARGFTDWIKAIVAIKATWSLADFSASWLEGARSLLRSGVTTVVDIEAVPGLVADSVPATPLRVVSCHELISIRHPETAPDFVTECDGRVSAWPNELRGLSPHAPYTTSIPLLRAAAETARARGWLLTTHVAESAEEFDMFRHARGAMFEWLAAQRDCADCGTRTPVEHLDAAGALVPGLLAVHANYLWDSDVRLLAARGVSVAHCPRSHRFFGHHAFPFDALRRAGVTICLGTDSMATVLRQDAEPLELNIFSEMRSFAAAQPEVSPEEIIRMVTVNGAKALGRPGEFGEISPGARADLIALPADPSVRDPFETALRHRGPVPAVMIDGEWAVAPGA
jgi:cytosine/adenosine deaminase-related metal-dependent hydrolase